MAIDWKRGIRTGLIMAAGQLFAIVVGKKIGLNEEQLKTAEYLGLGAGMGIAFNIDDKEKVVNEEKEKEPQSGKFQDAVLESRKEQSKAVISK